MTAMTAVRALVAVLAAVAVAPGTVAGADIGDRLLHTYTVYSALPLDTTQAAAAGWVQISKECDPDLGIEYAQQTSGADREHPTSLYFNAAGQIAGVDVFVHGQPKTPLVGKFWQAHAADKGYHMSVAFRGNASMCSATKSPEKIGDRVVINPKGLNYEVPLTRTEAVKQNYVAGACFAGMGTHYFKDLTAPNMTWDSANLQPIVPMYTDDGALQAIFFAMTGVEQELSGAHGWEPVPLINVLMCKNWCDKDCHFTGTSAWSTMHFYFKDTESITCPGGCSIGCCS